ncbi:amino acid ABC transporter permease [Streptomyces sp. NPDC059101]|uniref:amino acid ABC transporter permease n=1 Tax=Streptomyces sp. NPDC059101 TaxID=3346728 RepID=UPI003692D781
MTTVLYDLPGPRTRRRHRYFGLAGTVVLLALAGWTLTLLFRTHQFTAAKWTAFTYQGIQELLLTGLGNTLRAFGLAAAGSLLLGGVLAAGRLSAHRPLRWVCTLLVEFFRAMPVLVMIFFIYVALHAEPLVALVSGLTLYNGSVLAEVFRSGVGAVERGQGEAAYALGMRKTQVMVHVLAPQAVRAMLPAIISQLVVALKDTSLGFLITYEEFLHAGKLIASNLDYDLPFIPVVMIVSPIYIGMCMLLSWLATWAARRQRRNPRVEAGEVAAPEPATLRAEDHRARG